MLTRARAGISAEMAEDDVWQDVSARAAILPEDMQGIFMMIARAAREGLPCPGDAGDCPRLWHPFAWAVRGVC